MRKKQFAMNMQFKGKEEEVGSFRIPWEDLAESGEVARPVDRWFTCAKENPSDGICPAPRIWFK
jgi:hypothetical protein